MANTLDIVGVANLSRVLYSKASYGPKKGRKNAPVDKKMERRSRVVEKLSGLVGSGELAEGIVSEAEKILITFRKKLDKCNSDEEMVELIEQIHYVLRERLLTNPICNLPVIDRAARAAIVWLLEEDSWLFYGDGFHSPQVLAGVIT